MMQSHEFGWMINFVHPFFCCFFVLVCYLCLCVGRRCVYCILYVVETYTHPTPIFSPGQFIAVIAVIYNGHRAVAFLKKKIKRIEKEIRRMGISTERNKRKVLRAYCWSDPGGNGWGTCTFPQCTIYNVHFY